MIKLKTFAGTTELRTYQDAIQLVIKQCREGKVGYKHYFVILGENGKELDRGYYVKNDDKTITKCR